MTEYELASLLREVAASISQEFEFFVTASFAVILVGYFAQDRLKTGPRVVIAILYATSVAMFLLRYQNFTDQVRFIVTSLQALDSDYPLPQTVEVTAWMRRFIVLLGSVAAIYSLFRSVLIRGSANRKEDT